MPYLIISKNCKNCGEDVSVTSYLEKPISFMMGARWVRDTSVEQNIAGIINCGCVKTITLEAKDGQRNIISPGDFQ